MGWLTGFEPATARSTIWGSNQAELQPPPTPHLTPRAVLPSSLPATRGAAAAEPRITRGENSPAATGRPSHPQEAGQRATQRHPDATPSHEPANGLSSRQSCEADSLRAV